MNLPPPQSQKVEARPISFLLDDTAGGLSRSVTLAIRPEDLTLSEPSRMAIHQTLGGAWADNFGIGIRTLTIAGHTGWSRRLGGGQLDGIERFIELHEQVFVQWHERQKDAVSAGKDPDGVRLIFSDALDRFSCVVAPQSFTLRRSKTRPLLAQYQIVMSVLSEELDPARPSDTAGAPTSITPAERQRAGLDSMLASIKELADGARDARDYIHSTVTAPAQKFMNETVRLYGTVADTVTAADDVADELISVAQTTASAGANILRTIGVVYQAPMYARARLMQVASAYTNILCILRNALRTRLFVPDYGALFGASNCSSTTGGGPMSPLAGTNPFYVYAPPSPTLPLSMSDGAREAIRAFAETDVVLSPMSAGELRALLNDAAEGLAVA